ncbi:TetR family transcriptional regulator [Amycolatopsis sp. SID8362]|uniref:TetR/AcrR family transcriptional regulator n=1 Tax=Amycolatopsis sp. SID8362 TaxID=2690346 RepID=UPI00136F398A|nr:TetR family transcriptional regulator [Amycolatopsis sp. SID8362]NBH03476.1 TetR family transcriptional regulator [Amycolatopsis sp. SID8362]NED40176.1 TetR/AcrR family transcriptional regulator [Amycolatopsis sp. SID8362]
MSSTTGRRRADAERSIAAILDAAATSLGTQPQISMAELARTAGVGRVTLYAHFPSREAVLEAVLERTIAEAGVVLEESKPEDGPADEALRRLLRSSWQALDRHRRLFEVAQRELGPARLREFHDPAIDRIDKLVARGRQDGVFRTDLPLSWLVTTVYTLLHAAAEDVNAGRLPHEDAGNVLEATLMSAFAPPLA